METKALSAVRIGIKLIAGISAGYFVHKAIDKKANEMLEDGGMVNAFVVGAGQSALSITAGTLAFWTFG